MMIETDETINMPFMLNIDEAQLTLNAMIDSLFFFYQTKLYFFGFICETSHLYKIVLIGIGATVIIKDMYQCN